MNGVRLRVVILGVVMAATLTTNCSWLFVESAPDPVFWEIVPYTNCTRSNGLAILDVIFAASDGLGIVTLMASSETEMAEKSLSLIGGVVGVVVFTASAAYGFSSTRNCRAYYQNFATRRERDLDPGE